MNTDKINILFTGLGKNDTSLLKLKNNDKFNLIVFPTIEIYGTKLSIDDKNKIEQASKYNYIIFTSVNSVKYFIKALGTSDLKVNSACKIVAIGEKTASALIKNNIDVDLIPHIASSKSIDEMLSEKLVNGKSILIPGSALSDTALRKSLEAKGAVVDFVTIYGNRIPINLDGKIKEKVLEEDIDLYVFTSPSTFNNFVEIMKLENPQDYFSSKYIAAIGEVTKKEIESKKINVDIIPKEFNLLSLANKIIDFYNKG